MLYQFHLKVGCHCIVMPRCLKHPPILNSQVSQCLFHSATKHANPRDDERAPPRHDVSDHGIGNRKFMMPCVRLVWNWHSFSRNIFSDLQKQRFHVVPLNMTFRISEHRIYFWAVQFRRWKVFFWRVFLAFL